MVNGHGSSADAGVGARLGGGDQARGAQRAGVAIASVVQRAWGAERERSASTHTIGLQNGKLCMRVSDYK
eukprot:717501-Pleurochrysis_carterae.AAC.1